MPYDSPQANLPRFTLAEMTSVSVSSTSGSGSDLSAVIIADADPVGAPDLANTIHINKTTRALRFWDGAAWIDLIV